jgi:hypothetical protein
LNLLSQFLTMDNEIALFWNVFTNSLWISLLPCPLRKKYFTIILCSIRFDSMHPNIHNIL